MKGLLIFFMLYCSFFTNNLYFDYSVQSKINTTENRIYYQAPKDISKHILLVPAFDLLPIHAEDNHKRREYVQKVNQAAKEANHTLTDIIEKVYPFEFKLISLQEVDEYRNKGSKYFLDLVLMPKQMTRLKGEALIPSFEQHNTANKMYRNNNLQFHYYFYVRDLQNGDVYAGSKLKGNAQVYKGISKFLTQILKDL